MDACRRCFACKVPELRAIWWLVAYTSSSVSPSSILKFAGNVSQECQNNQTGYLAMCGDPGTELLPVQAWRSLKERSYGTIGYDPIDPRIPDTFAAAMMDRARQSGDVDFLAAAEAWERRDKGAPPGEQGIAFQHQVQAGDVPYTEALASGAFQVQRDGRIDWFGLHQTRAIGYRDGLIF